MTPRERAIPHSIDGRRRQRIARGSGTTVEQVNQLLEARKMMEKMMKQMGKGKGMPSSRHAPLGGMPAASAGGAAQRRSGRRHERQGAPAEEEGEAQGRTIVAKVSAWQ